MARLTFTSHYDYKPYDYDHKPGAEKPQNPFSANMMAFTSPEDMMKNLPKAMSNISMPMGGAGALMDSLQHEGVRGYGHKGGQ